MIYLYIVEMMTKQCLFFHLEEFGVISVLSNIAPKISSKMVHNYLDGNIEEARKVQLNSIPLAKALFSEVNPIPVKEALNIMGYDFGEPRLPLTKMTDKNRNVLKNEMEKFGLI